MKERVGEKNAKDKNKLRFNRVSKKFGINVWRALEDVLSNAQKYQQRDMVNDRVNNMGKMVQCFQ